MGSGTGGGSCWGGFPAPRAGREGVPGPSSRWQRLSRCCVLRLPAPHSSLHKLGPPCEGRVLVGYFLHFHILPLSEIYGQYIKIMKVDYKIIFQQMCTLFGDLDYNFFFFFLVSFVENTVI